jgi:TetR/AcrR family transcriptional regulator of autoinduction and epiphytic fitness
MTRTPVIKVSFKAQMLQAREDAIIEVVNHLLAEKGFEAMTVDEVAAQVGIAKASLYKHFPSKEDLAAAAMVRVMRKAQAYLQGLPAEATPLEQLRAVVRWTMELKLAGGMPSLPSQNSSLRATLIANPDYMNGLIEVSDQLAHGLKRRRRKGASIRHYPPLQCSTPCMPEPVTRYWSSSKWVANTPMAKLWNWCSRPASMG